MDLNMQQGTDAWKRERLGRVTASKIADVLATTSKGWGASRANYAAQLICERLTQTPTEMFVSAEMRWGTETEPQARLAYELMTGCDVLQIGFVKHPSVPMSGASPDGLVETDGLLELKCPLSATHIETLLSEKIPAKYIQQMQWQMACTGRQWCDYASFDPRLPAEMQLFVKRVPRDSLAITQLEREVSVFLAEINVTMNELKARYRQLEAA
jgi:putative phage-type endonuclease